MRRLVHLILLGILVTQSAACGLLLYPERQGQKSGRIDPGVAILDAAGLVVFIVPGLIAFGVDFITGCIYLPGGTRAAVDESAPRTIFLDPATLDQAALENVVALATGREIDLAAPEVEVFTVQGAGSLNAAFSAMQ